jgi:hypothetical protein
MTLPEVIQDIHALNAELETFEKKYGVLSEDFYQLYEAGKLRDEELEEIDDYGAWAASFRIRRRRMELYHQLLKESLELVSSSNAPKTIALPLALMKAAA